MKTAVFQLEALSCPSCVVKIEKAMSRTAGVEEVQVLFHSSRVKARYDETRTEAGALQVILADLGYPVVDRR